MPGHVFRLLLHAKKTTSLLAGTSLLARPKAINTVCAYVFFLQTHLQSSTDTARVAGAEVSILRTWCSKAWGQDRWLVWSGPVVVAVNLLIWLARHLSQPMSKHEQWHQGWQRDECNSFASSDEEGVACFGYGACPLEKAFSSRCFPLNVSVCSWGFSAEWVQLSCFW